MAYELTWAFDTNRVNGAGAVAKDKATWLAWYIWAALTGKIAYASGLWTQTGSSNSVTAGMDATDRFHGAVYTAGDWVRNNAGVMSWYDIQSPTQDNGLNVHVIVAYNTASDQNFSITLARGALSVNGTTSAIPTYASQITVQAAMPFSDGTTGGMKVQSGLASNGTNWIAMSKDGSGKFMTAFWHWYTTDNDSDDPNKFIQFFNFNSSGIAMLPANLGFQNAGTGGSACWNSAGTLATGNVAPVVAAVATTLVTAASGIDPKGNGAALQATLGIMSGTSSATYKPKGRPPDLFGCGANRTTGQCSPGTGTVQYTATNASGLWTPTNAAPSL